MADITAISGVTKYIGVSRKRGEDPQVLMGQAKYVDDIALPGTLEVAFLRSTHAHARLKNIELDKAQSHPDLARIFWSSFKVINKLNTGEPNHAFETI